MTLPFKVVAFDMDGTFLQDDKKYDYHRFNHVFHRLQDHGVQVVVASGNPAQILQQYFTEYTDQLTILAENGAQALERGRQVLASTLNRNKVHEAVAFLQQDLGIAPALSGSKQGYFPRNTSSEFMEHMGFYYPKHVIRDLLPLPADDIFQISMLVKDDAVPGIKTQLDAKFHGELDITPSGNDSIDITKPGINKGWGLTQLLQRWHLTADDLIAFGDGDNDLSMLQLAKYSYAMPNGNANVKATANYLAVADNNNGGVLATLEDYLERAEK
ncbi:Cof-type HAD-IIB family hydrolase [Ligilactobacillus saerimneri]|uniref:Cof-type HAD-IIB family hydrolase n=1 Tax=Ligilactobacillus saerimneri TaxID=228229 RepID=UPI002943E07D|nr:Cof-type HAD-IIB family hydrolase [Ligilactobacillus saerimneri]MDY4003360.1 Cof-type HAD-IIB family hydrolase [Ligilactobacillus saerimneri]